MSHASFMKLASSRALSALLMFSALLLPISAIGCAAPMDDDDGAYDDEPAEVEASSDALAPAALAAARTACTKKWAGNAICSYVFVESGKKILYRMRNGRVCTRRGEEWIINSSNGSVMGKRSKCLQWR
jgi:hypothetical protein